MIEKHTETPFFEISKIFRQTRKEYKEIVQLVSDGTFKDSEGKSNFEKAFEQLQDLNWMVVNEDPKNRVHALVSDYLQALKEKKTALIVAPTHQESFKVTQALRERLKENEWLSKDEKKRYKRMNLNFTQAKKLDPRNYEEGMQIKFFKSEIGIKRGEIWSVEKIEKEEGKIGLMLRSPQK